jgi:DNA repair protein RecO (recombination protein O)
MMRPTCAVMATNKPSVRVAASKTSAPLIAYVLHQYDWSETSLIVELFTRAQGRVVVAAKGAKRPTSQLRSVLLPFQPVLALLGKAPAEEQAEVRTLRSAEWAGGSALLPADQLLAGFYLNELLLKLLARQDPNPAVFDSYVQTLGALANHTRTEEAPVLRAFELLLLRGLGLLPELNVATLTAQPLQAQTLYTLHPEAGVMQSREGLPGNVWVALEAALLHAKSSGDSAALRQACSAQALALRQPLRTLLHYHLGHKPLRTRQVWQGVQKLSETLPA